MDLFCKIAILPILSDGWKNLANLRWLASAEQIFDNLKCVLFIITHAFILTHCFWSV